jgi:hypothetical protein
MVDLKGPDQLKKCKNCLVLRHLPKNPFARFTKYLLLYLKVGNRLFFRGFK